MQEIYVSLRSRSGQDIPVLVNGVRRQGSGPALNDCIVVPITQRIQYEDEILKAKKMAEAAMVAQKLAEATLKQQYERAVALAQITQQIRHSLELPQIFAVTAQEIHRCLGADRVGIYRFAVASESDGGRFVSEAVAPGLEAVMMTQMPYQGLGDHYRGIRPHGGTLVVRDSHDMGLLAEHQALFDQFQVRACLLVPDVDYFKLYNDAYGHQQGENCLYATAQAAQGIVCRSTDLLARYGGEEFVVILPNTDREGAIAVAEHIHQAIAALALPHIASAIAPCVTLSLGLSTLIPRPGTSSTQLIFRADKALYQAKNQGRNRSVVFKPSTTLKPSSHPCAPATPR